MSENLFAPLATSRPPSQSEARVLAAWKDGRVFEETLRRTSGGKPFVFYEGPPTANGMPHHGHVLTRVMKDLFPRYKTMDGYSVARKAGWDTHGLPVEVEVEKANKFKNKQDVEKFGIEPFVNECRKSVWKYKGEWEKLTERIGFWLDLADPYVTYNPEYVDSVWWALQQIHQKGYLHKGYKILAWCPVCQTGLSNQEVGYAYKEVKDPALTVAFAVKGQEKTFVLAWTTTPWTLLSNVALVVGAEIEYGLYELPDGRRWWLATSRADAYKKELEGSKLVETKKGKELAGLRYEPLFPFAGKLEKDAHKVVTGDFVEAAADEANLEAAAGGEEEGEEGAGGPTSSSGTGVVHAAPAFGQDDYRVCRENNLAFVQLVKPDGTFTEACGKYAGKWIKDADPEVVRELKERKLVVKHDQYKHKYPHCWRTDNPLIYYARDAWFVETTRVKDRMVQLNREIAWAPEHIRDGRMGKFLEGNRDWNVSRERFWATPLPVWSCARCQRDTVVGSRAELVAKGAVRLKGNDVTKAEVVTDAASIDPHRPWVDEIKLRCERCGELMDRDLSVVDCWFDSGSMPFAQWGYPHVAGSKEKFEKNFPADFICEAIDQTRGWFYTLHAISTLLFGEKAYKRCVVLGHVLDENGKKLSKSAKNYKSPNETIEKYGADAVRWFFYSKMTPGQGVRFFDEGVKDANRTFLHKILHVFNFFAEYAVLDGFDPRRTPAPPLASRPALDRWVISLTESVTAQVRAGLDGYDFHAAAGALEGFVDALSNWYVRRSRERAWTEATAQNVEKWAFYHTLHEVLGTLAKLLAPFVPFVAEDLHEALLRKLGLGEKSVHLERYPVAQAARIDRALEDRMDLARRVAALGKRARLEAKLKVRQPLKRAVVLFSNAQHAAMLGEMLPVVAEELNVKKVEVSTAFDEYVRFGVFPDWKTVGKRLGKRFRGKEGQEVLNAALRAAGPNSVATAVREGRTVDVKEIPDGQGPVTLAASEILVRLEAREGYAAAEEHGMVVVLDAAIDEGLRLEALAAEVRTAIQALRKFLRLPYEARVRVTCWTEAAPVAAAVAAHEAWLKDQTLCSGFELVRGAAPAWANGSSEPRAVEQGAGQVLDLGDEGSLVLHVRDARGGS